MGGDEENGAAPATANQNGASQSVPVLHVVCDEKPPKRYKLEVWSGGMDSVTIGTLKNSLKSKITINEFALAFNGRQLDDDATCASLGIKDRDELQLIRKVPTESTAAPETKYYSEMIDDAFARFDRAMKEVEAAPPGEDLQKINKDLARAVKSMQKNIRLFEGEMEYVTNPESRRALNERLDEARAKMREREEKLQTLNGACPHLEVLRKDTPPLAAPMESFFRRLALLHEVYHRFQEQISSSVQPCQDSLLVNLAIRACVDTTVLSEKVRLISTSLDKCQAGTMSRLSLDAQRYLKELLAKYSALTKGFTGIAYSKEKAAEELPEEIPNEASSSARSLLRGIKEGSNVTREVIQFLNEHSHPVTHDTKPAPPAMHHPPPVAESASPPASTSAPTQLTPQSAEQHTDAAVGAAAAASPPAEKKEAAPQPPPQPKEQLMTEEAVVAALKAGDMCKARLLVFYQKYNPDRLPSVDAILPSWVGREKDLFDQLAGKYAVSAAQQKKMETEVEEIAKRNGIQLSAEGGGGGCAVM